jgi:hypothetical protein
LNFLSPSRSFRFLSLHHPDGGGDGLFHFGGELDRLARLVAQRLSQIAASSLITVLITLGIYLFDEPPRWGGADGADPASHEHVVYAGRGAAASQTAARLAHTFSFTK